jgi:hypothetical protein
MLVTGEERRKKERMISRCFTRVPISGLGKPYLYHNLEDFTRMRGRLWSGV